MGLFSFLKKDKEDVNYDFTLNDLKKGFMLDYFLQTWEVKKVYLYDWGNQCFAREYLLDSGTETLYLYVEEDDGLDCSVWHKISLDQIQPNLFQAIVSEDNAPYQISYKNKLYTKTESGQGYSSVEGESGESELVYYSYKNQEGELISVNRTGEESFDVSHGHAVSDIEFSNILPR